MFGLITDHTSPITNEAIGLCCGMIGLPNVGKPTVFNALTGGVALAANCPFATVERGFIRAEVYHYDDLLACGSEAKVKEKGLFRLEDKDYIIKEADSVYFRFNV